MENMNNETLHTEPGNGRKIPFNRTEETMVWIRGSQHGNGKTVIAQLKNLGGMNRNNYDGNGMGSAYFIDDEGTIRKIGMNTMEGSWLVKAWKEVVL